MQIILSSNNPKKIQEFQEILKGFEVQSYREFLDEVEVEENGKSFEENAKLKVEAVFARLTHQIKRDFFILSDDSGLCVEALNGMPSIYSARFASIQENAKHICQGHFSPPSQAQSDEENNLKLLQCLDELQINHSQASFVCVVAMCGIIQGQRVERAFRGECQGKVIKASLKPQAFGYDPLFVPMGYAKTFDCIAEKNQISHRFKALKQVRAFLNEFSQ